jgi:hypothetical protein
MMQMPPVTGTDPFIGRTQELAELSVALDTALEGRGGLVMLAGEPGIGKTRLAEELDSIARDRGALVARGACYEGGGTPPYWPWIQTVRSLLSERDSRPELEALGAGAARIAEIVPEIHDIVPDLAPRPDTDPGQARFQFFDSMTAFLNNVAESQPMVVVLDDLHWADQSSLDLLEFVAQGVLSGRVLLIGGYRDMELSRKRAPSQRPWHRWHGYADTAEYPCVVWIVKTSPGWSRRLEALHHSQRWWKKSTTERKEIRSSSPRWHATSQGMHVPGLKARVPRSVSIFPKACAR